MLTHKHTLPPLLLLHTCAIAGALANWWPLWVPCITLAAHVALLAWGSATPSAGFFIRHVSQGRPGTLALTYDDGPVPDRTPALLDLLKREQAKATFFCIGRRVEECPELARRIVQEGHAIGVHTHRHPWWWGFMPEASALREIEQCADAIEKATGTRPGLMRPPFGVTSPATGRAMRASGLLPVAWDLRTFDTARSAEQPLIARMLPRVERASIVLMHDHANASLALTSALVRKARDLGRELVKLDRMHLTVRTLLAPIALGATMLCAAQATPGPREASGGTAPKAAAHGTQPVPLSADDPLVARLRGQARPDASVEAAFTQEKHLKGLAVPVTSEGRFAFQAPDLLRWEVRTPEPMTAVVGGGKVRISERGTERPATMRDKQTYLGIQRMVGGLLTGRTLDGGMPALFFRDGDDLLVELKPEKPGMRSQMERIELRFPIASLVLGELRITRPNGDVTITRFRNTRRDATIPASTFTLP